MVCGMRRDRRMLLSCHAPSMACFLRHPDPGGLADHNGFFRPIEFLLKADAMVEGPNFDFDAALPGEL
jgi:hypothetical protein